MTVPKSIGLFTTVVLLVVIYPVAVVFLLLHNTSQVYGFQLFPDLRTAIGVALRGCPMLAALIMIPISSFREKIISRLARHFSSISYTFAMLTVSLSLGITVAILTAVAIVGVCGTHRGSVYPGTCLWVSFEFVIDVTLIGIFIGFLHALTRRAWATFLFFAAYTTFVVIFGTRWDITSFIGFGSTVPVRLTPYSQWPLHDAAGWLFRAYWAAAASLLVAILHHFSHLNEPIIATMYKQWSASETRLWKYRFATAGVSWLAIAVCLFQFQQYALAKYRGPSSQRLHRILSEIPSSSRLRLTSYDLQLAYQPDRQTIRVVGRFTFENQEPLIRVSYFQLPPALIFDNFEFHGTESYRLTRFGNYVRIEWLTPLPSGRDLELWYSGTIRAAGPFDLVLQTKILRDGFFLTDADLIVAPRRSSCLDPLSEPEGAIHCEGENYTMTDLATGSIHIVAPAGFIAIGPGNHQPPANGQSVFRVTTPQLTKFMVACAHFVTTSVPATDGLPAIYVYEATSEDTALAQTARMIIDFYQRYWPAYRLPEFRIVESPTLTGEAVAFDGLIAIGDGIVGERDSTSAKIGSLAQFVLAHEISHQWWGYEVIPSMSPGELFVLESFAQFSAYKYLENIGVMSGDAAIQNEKDRYASARTHLSKNDAPLALLQQGDLELAYHKGPLVLLSLDKISENSLMEDFGELIRLYAQLPPAPAQPQQIIESLINRLPITSAKNARSMLFTSVNIQTVLDLTKPNGSQHLTTGP
jgi:Peptidase family M1 domain